MTTTIIDVRARRVWDSRGRPTVEAEVRLEGGVVARAIAPAGASMGSGEAIDLRDGGERLGGMDVSIAVGNVNMLIAPMLVGRDVRNQAEIDTAMIELDGTPNKSVLGGNATIAVSMAVLQAAAASAAKPLWQYLAGDRIVTIPVPEIQIFGGGAHAGRRIDVQDFLIMCPTAENFSEVLERTSNVYRSAGRLLKDKGRLAGVADEGGWWPAFDSNEEALDLLVIAIEQAGYTPGDEVSIALDVAATDFYRDGLYRLGLEGRSLDRDGMAEMLGNWLERYPILSVEDPFAEDDFEGFRQFTKVYGDKVQIVGDDLLCTNAVSVHRAADDKLVTCALIKPNQAGTITETYAALTAARIHGLGTIVSARSGETEDTTIAHLSVGWNAGQFKVGSIARSERSAKWNEILRIEEAVGERGHYAGSLALAFSNPSLSGED